MKALGLLVSLLVLAAGCGRGALWTRSDCRAQGLADLGRVVEPRFGSSNAWQPCQAPLSGEAGRGRVCSEPPANLPIDAVSLLPATCDRAACDHVTAVRILVLQPEDSEGALEMLESLAESQPKDAVVLNDLAAGYFLRAERQDRPADLVRARRAIVRALAADPELPAARFNQALIAQALLPPSLLGNPWSEVAASEPSRPWATEAREREAAVAAHHEAAVASSWPVTRERLLAAADSEDREGVRALAAPFLSKTQALVRNEILAHWAEALRAGQTARARVELERARLFGEEIHSAFGDRLLHEAVAAIDHSPRLEDLVEGHLVLAQAVTSSFDFERASAAAERGVTLLRRGGSPLAAEAEIQAIIPRALGQECDSADLRRLRRIATDATRAHHQDLAVRAFAQLGHCVGPRAEVESHAMYRRATDLLGASPDRDLAAGLATARAALLLTLGDDEEAWREIHPAILDLDHTAGINQRQKILSTAASGAEALESRSLALEFQEAIVRDLERALAEARPGGERELRVRLAIAYRSRGSQFVELGRYTDAARDLEQASELVRGLSLGAALQPRRLEAEALLAMGKSDPQRAVDLLDLALEGTLEAEPRTFSARLRIARAEANRRLGRLDRTAKDLADALAEIDGEERENLKAARGELGDLYFGRFGETVEQLLGLLVDVGRPRETFAVIERARAFEPFTRIRDLSFVPPAFERLSREGRPLELEEIQGLLPTGTALLSYSVLPDRLLVWVVTRDRAEWSVAPIGRSQVARWVRDIRQAVRLSPAPREELARPFETLIGGPLDALGGVAIDRLVLVPDEDLHGLPFAALWDTTKKEYLLASKTLSVAPSATLFAYSLLRDGAMAAEPAPRALLVGDPAFDFASPFARGLERLEAAAREVESIATIYPGAVCLVGEQATRRRWLAAMGASTILHYGGHAVANPRRPELSLLLLAPQDGERGELFARDLLSGGPLPRTRLVVLAACSTAGGQPIGALGLAPLVRPFLGAGVPAVLGSLWNVESSSARVLSESFHRRYRAGKDAAAALRGAQLELLESRQRGLHSVLAWAPYEVVGFASSPFPP